MPFYDIQALERQLENIEDNDAEAHKLYNNLGLAHAENRKFRLSLKAHREEKRACKRLVSDNPSDASLLFDLAIAYRRCGDVMLKVDRLVDANHIVIDHRPDVIRAAHGQHLKGLDIARTIPTVMGTVEVQAASAAVAQSALALALETREKRQYENTARCCIEAGRLADALVPGVAGITKPIKESMLLGASLNLAIALSGLSEKKKSKTLLQAIAIKARHTGDDSNLVRAVSNLGEEAGLEDDWDLCEAYVLEWVRLARKAGDEGDESDALRKLALAKREKREFQAAKKALQRALAIGSTRLGNEEAKDFLSVIEQDIEEYEKQQEQLAVLEKEAAEKQENGQFIEEAKVRLAAGNCAFELQRLEDVATHLERYFVLVDEYGCNTSTTLIPESVHSNAVANIGEAMWKLKRCEEAVKWATRELTVYDDVPGQAQAWCNLGVYLDDYGKKEKAIAALKTSIELADKCGDKEILRRAEINIELVEESMKVPQKTSAPNDANVDGMDDITYADHHGIEGTATFASRPQMRPRSHEMLDSTIDRSRDDGLCSGISHGEKSVIILSNQQSEGVRKSQENAVTACSQDVSTRRSRKDNPNLRDSVISKESARGCRGNESSRPSRGITSGECSSAGFKKVVDLAMEYKNVCKKRQHPTVLVRAMIVDALKTVCSILIARDAYDETAKTCAEMNVSGLFLNNQDVSVLFETLSHIGEEHMVVLNMSFNPMLTAAAYECLNPRSFSSPHALHGIKQLDVSCAGLSGSALRTIADALNEGGCLRHVTRLKASKNGLGRQYRACAYAVARLVTQPSRLEHIDLSLNLLPNTFMKVLVENIGDMKLPEGNEFRKSIVKSLDLHMNNRCVPTALLEAEVGDVISNFEELFKVMTHLETVDVRACGGNVEVRKALRDVSDRLAPCRTIVTVSETIQDEIRVA